MRSLPVGNTFPVLARASRPQPTHCIWCYWRARPLECERHYIGTITVKFADETDVRRSTRLIQRLSFIYGTQFYYQTVPLDSFKEAKRLNDLERMGRKWKRIIKAYESDRSDILAGAEGLFIDDRLRELDALLEQAREKTERTYGHRVAELETANP